jgi:predicted nucleic acid-binding protein
VIVVDASAIIAFFLREEGWESLKPYMKQTMSVDHVVKEFYNAV